jgi:hypothetical protein
MPDTCEPQGPGCAAVCVIGLLCLMFPPLIIVVVIVYLLRK